MSRFEPLAAVASSLAFASLCAVIAACDVREDDNTIPADAGSDATAALTPCLACARNACSDEWAACNASADCRLSIDCTTACAPNAAGEASAECVATCPTGGSGGFLLASRLAQGLGEGAGRTCTTCAKPPSRGDAASGDSATKPKNPILDQTCPASTLTPSCAKCEAASCCKTLAACEGNAECARIATCTSVCRGETQPDAGVDAGDESDASLDPGADASPEHDASAASCEERCTRGISDAALELHAARTTCVQLYCASPEACGLGNVTPCLGCAQSRCRDQLADCFGTHACRAAASCAAGCGGQATCVDACLASVPDVARRAFLDFNVCAQLECKDTCAAP